MKLLFSWHRATRLGMLLFLLAGSRTLPQAGAQARPAPNIVTQFAEMRNHGVALAYHLNGAPDPDGIPTTSHIQSIARSEHLGVPYLFCTQSDSSHGCLTVIEMPSRTRNGERLRSNRLSTTDWIKSVAPYSCDKVVKTITFDGTGDYPSYKHIGGTQICEDILAIALQDPTDSSNPKGGVTFIDISDPKNPKFLANAFFNQTASAFNDNVGTVGFTRLVPGLFLLAIQGWNSGQKLQFYAISEARLRDPNANQPLCVFLDEWNKDELSDTSKWHTGSEGKGALQSINLIRDSANGNLYLMGARNTTGAPGGEDWMDLYLVEKVGSDYKLTWQNSRHLYCSDTHQGVYANAAAGSGIYISPSGQLTLYVTQHYSSGPSNTVEFGEYGNSNYNVLHTASGNTGWVELYSDPSGWDGSDRSFVFDIQDWFKSYLQNFNKVQDNPDDLVDYGINDEASALRWCAPVGTKIVLYQDDSFGGDTLELNGTGKIEEYSNLKNQNFDDKISSLKFVGFDVGTDVVVMPEQSLLISLVLPLFGTNKSYPGVLSMKAGNYSQKVTIDKPMIIEARDGTVTLGKP